VSTSDEQQQMQHGSRLAVLEHRVGSIERAVGGIDASLREIARSLATLSTQTEKLTDHERRLRTLEAGYWKLVGGVMLASVVVQLVAKRVGFM